MLAISKPSITYNSKLTITFKKNYFAFLIKVQTYLPPKNPNQTTIK